MESKTAIVLGLALTGVLVYALSTQSESEPTKEDKPKDKESKSKVTPKKVVL
jgi:ABC-type Fe3+-citrate transport system substrate-binding protein